jgi:hypothetical protein
VRALNARRKEMISAEILEVVRQGPENSRFLVSYDEGGKTVMKDPLDQM